jgi:hypothetical protein
MILAQRPTRSPHGLRVCSFSHFHWRSPPGLRLCSTFHPVRHCDCCVFPLIPLALAFWPPLCASHTVFEPRRVTRQDFRASPFRPRRHFLITRRDELCVCVCVCVCLCVCVCSCVCACSITSITRSLVETRIEAGVLAGATHRQGACAIALLAVALSRMCVCSCVCVRARARVSACADILLQG